MDRKNHKMWRSFLLLVMTPLLAAFLIVGGIFLSQYQKIKSNYGIEIGDYNLLTNSYPMNKLTDDVASDIIDEMSEDSEYILDTDNQTTVNTALQKLHSALVVSYNDEIVYDGTGNNHWNAVLPEFGSGGDGKAPILTGDTDKIILKQLDFLTSNGQISVYILTDTAQMLPEMQVMISGMLIGVLLLVFGVMTGLILWTNKYFLAPIRKLGNATKRVANGDLDFTVATNREDEIGQLCNDFEAMRKQLKLASEERINQDKQYKMLIRNICHDLKTPITSIQGYVEGIMDGVANTEEKKEKYIRTIYNKAHEMDNLINELTIYSRYDTNRVPYNFQKLNVAAYLKDCIDELEVELEADNVKLSFASFCSPEVLIIADPEQLSRVIHNIISNAVKYMDKPERFINIRVKDVGDFVQFEIEDNGKGISGKDLPYIFERFYRADSSRNETKGSGIGLSIVQKILDDHGGRIWATSKENIGTTMYFVLRKYQEVPANE